MRYTASIAIASGASTLGQSYTLWVRSVHCVLNMQMSGTDHLGGSLWHQHFFSSVNIYASLFTVSYFVVFLL